MATFSHLVAFESRWYRMKFLWRLYVREHSKVFMNPKWSWLQSPAAPAEPGVCARRSLISYTGSCVWYLICWLCSSQSRVLFNLLSQRRRKCRGGWVSKGRPSPQNALEWSEEMLTGRVEGAATLWLGVASHLLDHVGTPLPSLRSSDSKLPWNPSIVDEFRLVCFFI